MGPVILAVLDVNKPILVFWKELEADLFNAGFITKAISGIGTN